MPPATIAPEQAPILWMMTFSPRAFLRFAAEERPMAMIAMGIAASKSLAHLQSQIGSGGREEHRHEHAPGHRPCVDLGIILVRTHHRLVLFVRFELAKRALGQFDWFCFLIFHCCYFRLFDALYGCLSLDCCSTCGMCLNAAAASFVFRPPGCPNVLMTDFRCKNT